MSFGITGRRSQRRARRLGPLLGGPTGVQVLAFGGYTLATLLPAVLNFFFKPFNF